MHDDNIAVSELHGQRIPRSTSVVESQLFEYLLSPCIPCLGA